MKRSFTVNGKYIKYIFLKYGVIKNRIWRYNKPPRKKLVGIWIKRIVGI